MTVRLPTAVAAIALFGACRFGPDPDKSRFSCARNSDCGSGYECALRLGDAGGACFPLGYCAAFDFTSDNAHCGDCATACAGSTRCIASSCRSDCSDGGLTDCQYPACAGLACSAADASVNCGSLPPDGGSPDAGTPDAGTADGGMGDAGLPFVRACVPRESICDDGLDNDGDGATDCADDDCEGKTCAPGKICRNRTCQ